MLFNSYEFLFLFLPITAVGFYIIGRHSHFAAAAFLAAASFAFYGWWDPRYISLLAASSVFNFVIGRGLAATPNRSRSLLVVGVAVNLALLGWYKYANFFVDNLVALTGADLVLAKIVLPLGISFFTFTQIAFLVDAYRGEVREYSYTHYALFVSFFPHLIAGPILHHKEMMPQFASARPYKPDWDSIVPGLALFFIGLLKKVGLADGIAPFANDAFSIAATGRSIDFLHAWSGALAYTFQLYFDFSGYSDMAVGGALLFGIRLPLNFNSPYKASNIIEFWRRWHMTLSRFVRDYIYIPLGGSRRGHARTHVNIMAAMLLGGLWHGAGWTFIAWGGLHGFYLLVNHAWRSLGLAGRGGLLGRALAWTFTFVAVVVAWVLFRASDMASAFVMLKGLAGMNGIIFNEHHRAYFGPLVPLLESFNITFESGARFSFIAALWNVACLAIVLLSPNSQQWVLGEGRRDGSIAFRPTPIHAVGLAAVAALGIGLISGQSEFLYFNF